MRRGTTALALVVAAMLAAPAAAQAAADIEGIWSYKGGQVAVQASADGTFTATVIRRAAFSDCVHNVGERIWTGITPQPDGSYRGGHQWFAARCQESIGRGNTAYRVLNSTTLRVCFADPASTTVQPTIALDGTPGDIERPCADFDLAGPLPAATATLGEIADLPSSTRCRTSRSLRIRLREPAGDALASVIVTVSGRRVRAQSGAGATAPIVLTGLPEGRYVVKIHATTVLGRIIAGKRQYRTCA